MEHLAIIKDGVFIIDFYGTQATFDMGDDTVTVIGISDGWSHGEYKALKIIDEVGPTPVDMIIDTDGIRVIDGIPTRVVTYRALQRTKAELLAYLADVRYRKEVGGITWDGSPIFTDRESQQKILSERVAISEGERHDGDPWKLADGTFRALTNAEFTALSSAVRVHVREAFGLEGMVQLEIESGDITTYTEIDQAFA